MPLQRPKEPLDIKNVINSRQALVNSPAIDWDSYMVWGGSQNQLPGYLWAEWKSELSPKGWTWQKFTKLLKHATIFMVYWSQDRLPWEALLKEITKLVEGEYGTDLARR